jgi:hypothetical protein
MTPESAGDAASVDEGAASGGGQATAASTLAGCEVLEVLESLEALASTLLSGGLSAFGSSVDI